MANNTVMDLNNVSVAANNNSSVAKEEKVMNNVNVAAQAVLEISIEALKGYKKDQLLHAAEIVGLQVAKSTKKAQLVEMLKPYTAGTATQYRKGEVNNVIVTKPNSVVDQAVQAQLRTNLVRDILIAWSYQSSFSLEEMAVAAGYKFNPSKGWKKRVLFYEPTKTKVDAYKISLKSRQMRVVGDALRGIGREGSKEEIEWAFKLMEHYGYCHLDKNSNIHISEAERDKIAESCKKISAMYPDIVKEYKIAANKAAKEFLESKNSKKTNK